MLGAADLENRMVLAAMASPLGQPATYAPLAGGSTAVRVALNRRAIETLTEAGTPARTEEIEAFISTSALASAPVRGDAITVDGATHTVIDVGRDGQRAYRLVLQRRA